MRYSWYCHVVWERNVQIEGRAGLLRGPWLAGSSRGGTIWRRGDNLATARALRPRRGAGLRLWSVGGGIRNLARAAAGRHRGNGRGADRLPDGHPGAGLAASDQRRTHQPAPTSAAPTSATPTRATPRVYDALGDSYASGAGVEPYDEDTCMRSAQAPGRLVDAQSSIVLDDLVACAGATTGDIADQVRALDAETDLVTVSIGGNDVRWAQSVGTCIIADESSCASAVQDSEATAREVLPGRLDTAYGQIREAAPKARVLVTGYARLFTEDRGDYQSGLGVVTGREQTMMNEGADALNEAIAAAAARHGFDFVDVTGRFVEHGVNAPQPWILGFGTSAPFHPTAAGYQAYAEAIVAAVDHP